jgi:Hydrogenase maturation factor
MDTPSDFTLSCPIPISDYPTVLLAHGGGGKLSHMLIERMMLPAFGNPALDARHDGAVFTLDGGARLAFTTDSYVIHPLFFPGGDIGSLAVHGTVNDLSMCGARPLYLSAGFIIEEGLPMETLWQIVRSMQQAAQRAGVQIVTGDTKVVDRGKADGLFINTAGVGVIEHDCASRRSPFGPAMCCW